MYKIMRYYAAEGKKPRKIKSGLTLKQAQTHCENPKTHKLDAKGNVIWFDGYTEQ